MSKMLKAPVATDKMPPATPYIMVNEVAERYAFYSVDGILILFLLGGLLNLDGDKANLTEEKATFWKHLFKTIAYFSPVIGSLISDIFWGKFKTIIIFSIVYCVGFLAVMLDQTYIGALIGLGLIATGTGVIKPCISANVGDQFGHKNEHLISRAYNYFYWAVNVGAFLSLAISPWIYNMCKEKEMYEWAFAVPGIFMVLATVVYWLGRKRIVDIRPKGMGFLKDLFSKKGMLVIVRLFFCVFIFTIIYWAMFEQTTSKWVIQAEKMDLTFVKWSFSSESFLGGILGKLNLNEFEWKILPAQVQAVNCILVLTTIPFFTFVVYPLINKFFKLTPLRKIGIGFFITLPSFAIPAYMENWIAAGEAPTVWWQVLAYWFITSGEVMISIPAMEFAYTQAPKSMKSLISSLNLLAIAMGNMLVSAVNWYIQNDDGTVKLQGADYYWFFTKALLVSGVLFCIVAMFYKGKTYIQDEAVS